MSKKKPAPPKPVERTSVFSGVKNYNVDLGGLASSNTSKSGNGISATSSLNPSLSQARDNASQGFASSLATIARPVEQQVADVTSGNNPWYNLAQEQAKRQTEQAMGAATNRFAAAGLDNSTSRGAFEGKLASDALLRDLTLQAQAIDMANSQARANAGVQQNAISGLSGLAQIPLSVSTNMFQVGSAAQDAVAQQNAALQDQYNQQMYQWKQQQRSPFQRYLSFIDPLNMMPWTPEDTPQQAQQQAAMMSTLGTIGGYMVGGPAGGMVGGSLSGLAAPTTTSQPLNGNWNLYQPYQPFSGDYSLSGGNYSGVGRFAG